MQEVVGLDQSFYLQSLEAEIQMADLYRKVQDLADPFVVEEK